MDLVTLVPLPRGYHVHPEIHALAYRLQAGRLMVLDRADATVKRYDLAYLRNANDTYDPQKLPDYALTIASDSTIPEEPWY